MTNTDPSIIRGAGDPRDGAAWERFHSTYRPLLLNYVRGRARDLHLGWGEADVEEVVQEVFIKLFRRLPKFVLDAERGRFRTYLYRIVMNAVADKNPDRDAGRSRKHDEPGRGAVDRHGGRPGRAGVLDAGQVDLDGLAGPEGPEPGEEWNAEYRKAVLNAVLPEVRARILPVNPNKWASFEQHVLNGRPAAAVAADLGINANLVYQNTARVMAEVRKLCREAYEEGLGDDGDLLPG